MKLQCVGPNEEAMGRYFGDRQSRHLVNEDAMVRRGALDVGAISAIVRALREKADAAVMRVGETLGYNQVLRKIEENDPCEQFEVDVVEVEIGNWRYRKAIGGQRDGWVEERHGT